MPQDQGTTSGESPAGHSEGGGVRADARELSGGLRSLERALSTLRHAIRVHLVVQRGAFIVACLLGSAIAVGLLDFGLRLPMALRIVLWLLGAAAVAWGARRLLWPAVRFNPSLTDLALRVEASEAGREGGWQGILASGLELGRHPSGEQLGREMSDAAAQIASARFLAGRFNIPGLLDNVRLRRALTELLVVFGLLAGLAAWQPALVRIGTQRIATPWTNAQWPKRTGIEHADNPAAHALGGVFPLRAVMTHRPGQLEQQKVVVNYRAVGRDGSTSVQRALLTPQGTRALAALPEGQADLGAARREGDLFEQLLDTQRLADLAGSSGLSRSEFDLEFWFETSDDATEPVRVRMVEAPRVAATHATVTPPVYAQSLAGPAGLLSGKVEAGNGLDAAASVGPILSGSMVELHIALSKDVPVPGPGAAATEVERFLAATMPALLAVERLETQLSARELVLRFQATGSLRLGVNLTDEHGIRARDPSVYRIDVVDDLPPRAAVIEPAQDESVLATAIIPSTGEGRDDLGLAWVALFMQIAKSDPTSVGAAPEPQGDPAVLVRTQGSDAMSEPDAPRLVRAASSLDLSEHTLRSGDEVWLTAIAADDPASGQTPEGVLAREPATSPVRRLRIISESELVEQFQGELTSLRDAAHRLEQDQTRLMEQRASRGSAQTPEEAAKDATDQAAIARKLSPVQQGLQKLLDRASRNRLDDEALNGLLEDANDTAEAAQTSAAQAAGAMDENAKATDGARQERLSQETSEKQAQAAQELTALADMLGQGEDDWAVRRGLEKLLTEQRQLRAQSAAAGERTQGRPMSELSREERDDLERLARKQQELAQRAAQALDTLEERAQQMQETSSAQAQAMQHAASRARQKQLVQKQSEASDRLRQNQTGQAQQNQQQAEEAIEEALESLDEVQQQRDEQLRRVLADIAESLRVLVEQQETQLGLLAKAQASDGAPTPPTAKPAATPSLDRGMMLLHQNTLGVLKKVREETRGAEALEQAIDGAQQAQSAAVSVLRQESPDLSDADEMERLSLSRLREALELAEKAEEDAQSREEERVRNELRKAYRELLELQVVIKADADALIGGEQNRRTRQSLREVGKRQDDLRTRMSELRSESDALAEARVFDYAHTRFDRASADASKDFAAGQGSRSAQRNQAAAVAILQSLVEALRETKPKDDELEDGQDGGGGGGGGGGGTQQDGALPPLTELVLLRGMQAEAAARTRALDEQGADAAEMEEVTRLQNELRGEAQNLLDRLEEEGGPAPAPTVTPPPEGDDPQPTGNESDEDGEHT